MGIEVASSLRAAGQALRRLPLWTRVVVWSLMVVANLRQQPGLTTWDTKFDLTAEPGAFMGRSLHLWNADASFGELQNQAYGYLFPQGPFFALGEVLGVEDWVWQRLWSALLLIAAYEGVRAIARTLGFTALPATLGGIVYALSPRLLGAVGVLSGEVLPTAVLPWAVLPLLWVRMGKLSARQGALWSGVALLFMSGVNAAGVLATFPLLIAVICEQWRRPHGRRLAAWWAGAVVAATTWWVIPLLLLGKYSPPFLDFIETSTSTTASTSWANSVRGTEHWLAYYSIGDQPWWPAAHQVATTPWLVILGGLVAAFGLIGLAHRDLPARPAWLAAALVGLLCLTAANSAHLGSLVDVQMRGLLDGVLAPFRNVHKVDPIVRLPLALGFAHATALLVARVRDADLRRIAVGVVTAGALATGLPLATGDMRMPGFEQVPDAWAQTADYLANQPSSRALVLPGSGFGLQSWGWTIDEPLQGEARSDWVTRSQAPLVPGPTARFLDSIERRITSGEGSEALAPVLARAGITHVVLRRDLDPFIAETVAPDRAEAALLSSPGLRLVAGFGHSGFADIAMISVYEVDRPSSQVSLLDADSIQHLVGAPDDLLPAHEAGAIGDAPTFIVPDASQGPSVVGDTYTRVERNFGRVHDAVGDVMAANDPARDDRPALDFPGVDGVQRVSARLVADGSVTASSSQGYSDEFGPVRPEFAPSAAFDGDLTTAWRSGTLQRPTDQWIQVVLDHPVVGGNLQVQFVNVPSGAEVVRARVEFHGVNGVGSEGVYGVPANGRLLVPIPNEASDRVRIEVVEARGENPAFGHVAVAEIGLPDVETGRTLVVPAPVGADDALVFRSDPPRRACTDIGLGANCVPGDVRRSVDGGRMDRTFEVTQAGSWAVSGHVVAVPGRASAALLAPVNGAAIARATSVLSDDPAVSGVFAFDGDVNTPWLSQPSAPLARLVLTWKGTRTIRGLSFVGAPGSKAVTPQRVELRSRGVERSVDFGFDPTIEPFRARGRLVITFPRPATPSARNRPIGVGEVQIEGLEGLEYSPVWTGPTGATCGLGPQVRIDGVVHDTEVSGNLSDVRLGTPLRWRVCDGEVVLEPGQHRLTVSPTLQFQATGLALLPSGTNNAIDDATSARTLNIGHWGDTHRDLTVGPGAAAVVRVAESVNPGWVARLDGQRLETVTLDGWQQGYMVPAGEGGTITLTYQPDAPYRAGLLIGLVLAVLLVLAAVAGQALERGSARVQVARIPPAVPVDTDVDALALPAQRKRAAVRRLPRLPTWGRAWAGLGLWVLGGPVSGAGFALAAWPRARRVAAVLGALSVALSGLLAAWAENTAFGRPPDFAIWSAAFGVGLIVGSAVFVAPEGQRFSWLRAGRATREWLSLNRVVTAGVVLIVTQAAVRWWLASGSYYWQDDFVHLDLAHRTGLSSELVLRQHNEHVEFLLFALFWVISLGDGLSFLPGVITLVVLQFVAAVLFWLLLLQLFGKSRWLLVPLAGYLFTPISLVGGTWLASGVEAFSLHIALFGALIGLARWRATGRRRWAGVSLLAFVVGLLCWQKAAAILPALLAVDLLVLSAGTSVRQRMRSVATAWWYWVALTLVLGAYIAVYASLTTSESFGGAVDGNPWKNLQEMVLSTFVPGMLGGPWTNTESVNSLFPSTPLTTQVACAVFVAAIFVTTLVRSGRAALAGWLLAISYLAGDVALLFAGRSEFLGLVARDPRYFVDAVPVVLIGVSAACAAPRRRVKESANADAGTSAAPTRARGLALKAVPIGLCLALTGSGLTTTGMLAPGLQHEEAGSYLENLAIGVAVDPGASVASAFAPDDIALTRSTEMLLGAVGREQRMDQPGIAPRVVAGSGEVVPAELNFIDLDVRGPQPECGWSLGASPIAVAVLEPVQDKRALQIGIVSGQPGVLHLLVDGVEQASSYPAGLSAVYFSVTGLEGTARMWVSDTVGGACVSRVQRGALWPVER